MRNVDIKQKECSRSVAFFLFYKVCKKGQSFFLFYLMDHRYLYWLENKQYKHIQAIFFS